VIENDRTVVNISIDCWESAARTHYIYSTTSGAQDWWYEASSFSNQA